MFRRGSSPPPSRTATERAATSPFATTRSGVVALALVALVALAGCSGAPTTTDAQTTTDAPGPTDAAPATNATATTAPPSTTDAPTTRATTDRESTTTPGDHDGNDTASFRIPVRGNGTLPFDHNETYARTMTLLGLDDPVDPPSQIYLYRPATPWQPTVSDPFALTLMDARESSNFSRETRTGLSLALSGTESRTDLEFTVVHEYVHNAQFARIQDTPTWDTTFSDAYQRHRAAAAVVEGAASYVALEYLARYENRSRAAVVAETDGYRNASPAGKYAWAPYHFGREYVAERVDSPADHWRLYEEPPQTTEELIHGLEPGSEPPKPLSVTVDADAWSVEERETRGELFARVVLASELAEPKAARGAAGWGNDELVAFSNGSERAFAWTLRWDDAANATEFVDAFGAATNARSPRSDGGWTVDDTRIRLVRVSPETVVVFTGPGSFVDSATATGSDGNVTVGGPAAGQSPASRARGQAWYASLT
ncbi:hypothetical protein [Halorubellus litoreus]|uniref:Lipoprotein n=1 Tax=Halorubellus litoreus TaxID=755308 RepID=A0ABD5VDK4_9EURY